MTEQTRKELDVLEVKGTPLEMGRQHGEAKRELIKQIIVDLREALCFQPFTGSGLSEQALMQEVRTYIPPMEAWAPRITDEIRGISQGADVSYEDAFMLLISFATGGMLLKAVDWRTPQKYIAPAAQGGCTCFAVLSDVTADGETLIGQTVDWYPHFAKYWFVLKAKPDKGPSILAATVAGLIPVGTGVNSAGISVNYNFLATPKAQYGVESLAIGRVLLEQERLGDCIAYAINAPRANAWGWLIADENEAFVMEVTSTDAEVFSAEDGILVHSNCFITSRFKAEGDLGLLLLPDSAIRLAHLKRLLKKKSGQITLDYIKECYTDHEDFPTSICRHPLPGVPDRANMCSNAMIVTKPKERKLYLTPYPVCEHTLVEYST